jgi:Leucine-rich repeat (LRR) protein
MSRHDMFSKPQNMSAKTFHPEKFMAEMLGAINQNDPRHIALTRPMMSQKGEVYTAIPWDKIPDPAKVESPHLRNHEIERLSPKIKALSNLIWLDLADNPLIELPEEFGALQNLRFLRLSDTGLMDITNLEALEAFGNQLEYAGVHGLKDLPESFGQLKELVYLRLDGARLKKVPASIFELKKLDNLDLGFNLIKEIPEAIGELTELVYLKLSRNNFTRLPDSIGRLKKLRRLRLDNLDLEYLPESIGGLSSLEMLEICYGRLGEVPTSIQHLKNLKHIYLYKTEISDIDMNVLRVMLPDVEIHLDFEKDWGISDEEE